MPKFGPYIKNIDKKIESKIANLGLVPDYKFDFEKNIGRFYTTPCKTKEDKKVIFKMRVEDYPETKDFFEKEIKVNQLFASFRGSEKDLPVPKFLDGDYKSTPEWIMYDFIDGSVAGNFYDGIYAKNIGNFPVDSFIGVIEKIHKMSILLASGQNLITLEKRGHDAYLRDFNMYGARMKPFFKEREIDKVKGIFNSYENLLNRKTNTVTHGDLHPGNIILMKKGGVAVIDWFYVHLNNIAFDFAFLFTETDNERFRKKLLEKFVKKFVKDKSKDKKEFYSLFRLSILRIVPQKINILFDSFKNKEETMRSYRNNLSDIAFKKMNRNLKDFKDALYEINFF